MSYQELEYLRNELNQRCEFHCEQTNKVINTVLITCGGVLAILGVIVSKLELRGYERAIFCFTGATIFLVSNIVIYLFARKYHDVAKYIFKLGAYILVFYEKRPSSVVKVSENFCWELINFEMSHNDPDEIKNNARFYKRDDEYKILILISLFLIVLFSVSIILIMTFAGASWGCGKNVDIIYTVLSSICVFYILLSIVLYFEVQGYTSLKNDCAMRANFLKRYFQYSIETGHYTEEEIKDRFGDIYEVCKRYR
jgi:hypothetical protein